MPESLPQNNHPLHQAAKSLLVKAGEPPHPDKLYAHQLMNWGLQNQKVSLDPQVGPRLEDNLGNMLHHWEPAAAHAFLLGRDHGESPVDPAELRSQSPEQGARTLLDALNGQLQERVPGYSIQPPPV